VYGEDSIRDIHVKYDFDDDYNTCILDIKAGGIEKQLHLMATGLTKKKK
jgi:hypothetical protein